MIFIKGIASFQVFLFLLLLGLLAYFNAIFHPFVHDDIFFIQKNPSISELNFSTVFSAGTRFDENNALINSYYRPLLELLYRLQYKVFHLNPYAYHLFNILLHVLNSFIVYRLMLFLFSLKKVAFCIAAFFLIHPIQSEAVACISGISNLLFAFFFLNSFYFYLTVFSLNKNKNKECYSRRSNENSILKVGQVPHSISKKRFNFFLSIICFFFALLSKEQAIMLPFLIFWYELCFGKRGGRTLLRGLAPYFLIGVFYFLLRKLLIGSALGSAFGSPYELWLRILAIPRTLLMYLRGIMLPYDLHYYRSTDILQPFLLPTIILFCVMSFIIILVWRAPQPQKHWLLFGSGWFLITLGPTLNILPLINEYSLILTSEHFLYLPLVGVLIFLMALGVGKKSGILILIGMLCIILTIKQNTYWRNEIALFERVVKYEKGFGRGHILLAKAYLADGQFKKSIVENKKALHIMQNYVQKVGNTDVRNVYLGFINGIHVDMGVAYNNLGVHYAIRKNRNKAVEYFQKAIQMTPDNPGVIKNLRKIGAQTSTFY